MHKWIKQGHTTQVELRAFLGIILNMGLVRKFSINSCWDKSHECLVTPFYEHFRKWDHFWLFMKFLHIADNETMLAEDIPQYNRLYSTTLFSLHQNISVDESMIGYESKTLHLLQYMPQICYARFGIKVMHYRCGR